MRIDIAIFSSVLVVSAQALDSSFGWAYPIKDANFNSNPRGVSQIAADKPDLAPDYDLENVCDADMDRGWSEICTYLFSSTCGPTQIPVNDDFCSFVGFGNSNTRFNGDEAKELNVRVARALKSLRGPKAN